MYQLILEPHIMSLPALHTNQYSNTTTSYTLVSNTSCHRPDCLYGWYVQYLN